MTSDASATAIVLIDKLTVYRDSTLVLDSVELAIEPGECVGVLGLNGAGKSTLYDAIMGLIPIVEGTITIRLDESMCLATNLSGIAGYAPQEVALAETMTAEENLTLFSTLAPANGSRYWSVAEVAGLFSIQGLMSRTASTLSGGERRRLSSGMALVGAPSIVILDEPTAGLDVTGREMLLDGIKQIAMSGCAVLYTTHHLSEVDALCDRHVVVKDRSILAQSGTIGEEHSMGSSIVVRCANREENSTLRTFLSKHQVANSENQLIITTSSPNSVLSDIGRFCDSGGAIEELHVATSGAYKSFFDEITG